MQEKGQIESELSPHQVQGPGLPRTAGSPREAEVSCGSQWEKGLWEPRPEKNIYFYSYVFICSAIHSGIFFFLFILSLLLWLLVKTTKPGWQYICLQHSQPNIVSPPLRPYNSEKQQQQKRFLSKYYCSLTMYLVTQELWWRQTRFILFSWLLTWHPLYSPWIRKWF